ncbi:MAG: RluA family pseudouridine synthase [Alphaproteobacteria bacterium]|nr:RluA family pseudouridine synthase [Alphaproteobacteria bacterium]
MARRDYQQSGVSDEDDAWIRSFVIHEDEALLAFNKPAGLPVQTRNPDDRTLDSLLAAFAKSNGKRPRLVHRLDAQTSGVILAGKTQPAAAALSAGFAGRDVRKTYLAVVSGAPLAQHGGDISIALARYRPRPELELMRAARPGDGKPQEALTRWTLLASNGMHHLLSLAPETGRMHQIRAHLSLMGRPILGDPYYGGATTLRGEPVQRMMLHAVRIAAPHPSGGRFALYAAPPQDFAAALTIAELDLATPPVRG